MRFLLREGWAGDSITKRIRHTSEQIFRKLKSPEQLLAKGKSVAVVCRALKVAQLTYNSWRQLYSSMQAEDANRLTQLEKENSRIKKLLAETGLEKAML